MANEDTLYMDQLSPVWFTNTSSTTENISWDFGDGEGTSVDIEPMYFFDDTGTFEVVLTISGGCGDQTYSQTIVVIDPSVFDTVETDTTVIDTLITQVNAQTQIGSDEIKLYYHQNTLYFSSLIQDKEALCLVYDVHGKIVMPRITAYQKGSIDLPNLAHGMYIAVIESPNRNTTKKFVISDLNR